MRPSRSTGTARRASLPSPAISMPLLTQPCTEAEA